TGGLFFYPGRGLAKIIRGRAAIQLGYSAASRGACGKVSRPAAPPSAGGGLQGDLGAQRRQVAADGGHGEPPAAAPVADRAVVGGGIAVDLQPVPAFGVADVADRQVVVLAPEERRLGEALPAPEDVARRDHAVAL